MKKLMVILGVLFITGCAVKTSSNIDINPDDIKIIRKGNLCFGVIASRKALSMSATGLGFTYIPCEKLDQR